MARKKSPKRHWLRILVLLIATPLIVWAVAFLVWLYWYDLKGLLADEPQRREVPKAARTLPKDGSSSRPGSEAPQERITDEDRRKLEDILKQRN